MTMFERFTAAARQAVVGATEQAQRRVHPEITDEHLLLALVRMPTTRAGQLLAEHGVDEDGVVAAYAKARRLGGLSDSDTEVLLELGIDVREVVANVERSLGPDAMAEPNRRRLRRFFKAHRPFSATAKSTIEGALREAVELRHREIGDEHILLALLNRRGVAADFLAGHDLTHQTVRQALRNAA
ncbi:Clp protease N-terminal domain-containing protein [Saccharopolyspora antimicrobica]|nr:Clp protease N-terminal domain-containing protein [Saccharopolyspora antimicrobica]